MVQCFPMSTPQKSKSIQNLENRMGNLQPDSFRYQILDAAKNFKSSWIQLGQFLFTAYKDKLYKDWGYLTFEAYCSKEIGIRQNTALKLLKSYSFLEKEEPEFVRPESLSERKPDRIPSVDAINTLRLAHENDRVSETQYDDLRQDILEDVKEDAEIKKKVKYILKSGPKNSANPAEDKKASLKKLALYLKNYKNDVSLLDVPPKIMKKLEELLDLLEDYQKP